MMDSHPCDIRSSWRCAWASPAKIKMNPNGLSSGIARVVERCKAINGGVRTATATTTSPGRELLSPQLSSSSSSSSSSASFSSSCSAPEHASDAFAIRVHPYSRSCRKQLSTQHSNSKAYEASPSFESPPSRAILRSLRILSLFHLTPSK
jgi:hypothetical protein